MPEEDIREEARRRRRPCDRCKKRRGTIHDRDKVRAWIGFNEPAKFVRLPHSDREARRLILCAECEEHFRAWWTEGPR